MIRTRTLFDTLDLFAGKNAYYEEHPDESWPELSYLDDDENEVTVIDYSRLSRTGRRAPYSPHAFRARR